MKWPAGAPIEILDIPLIKTLTDASAASAAIVKTMAEDQISPEGAASTAAVIERAIEAIDSKTRSPLLSLRSRRMGDEFSTTPHALEEPAVRFSESFPSVIVIRGGLPGNGPTPADVERACTEGAAAGQRFVVVDSGCVRSFRAA